MPKAKRGYGAVKRRKLKKLTKGQRGARSKLRCTMKEAADHALQYAYIGRRQRKRTFRSLWIVRINAAAKENGISYRDLIFKLKNANVGLNRKVLADMAVKDPQGFTRLIQSVR